MYSRALRNIGIGRNERISDSPMFRDVVSQPELPLPPEPELSPHHQMILLKLRGGDVAKALLAKMIDAKIGEPSASDWRSMIEAGYVRRTFERSEANAGYHSPHGRLIATPTGDRERRTFTTELCRRYSVHLFERTGGRGTGLSTYTRCSCGQFSRGPEPNDRFGQSRIRNAEDAHLRSVMTSQSASTRAPPQPQVEAVDPGIGVAGVVAAMPGISRNDQPEAN